MSKKNFIKIYGYFYETTKEDYEKNQKDNRRHRYLEETKKGIVILSYNAMDTEEMTGESIIADETVNVEETAIKIVMIDELHKALSILSDEELHIINALFYEQITERNLAEQLHISQPAVNKKKNKILNKLKDYFEKNNFFGYQILKSCPL